MNALNESLVSQLVRSSEKYNTFEKIMTLILTIFYQNKAQYELNEQQPKKQEEKPKP